MFNTGACPTSTAVLIFDHWSLLALLLATA